MRKIKIAQFGEGNFLRTFIDSYFTALNEEGLGDYEVTIIKPITFGSLATLKERGCKYHIVLRGVKEDKAVEEVREITSVKDAIDPFEEENRFYSLAKDKDLKIFVSNTTEAGIVFNKTDKFDAGLADISYPAKLTKFLLERYKANLPGVYLLPVELIDNNGEALEKAVNEYIDLWKLDDGFKEWNKNENHYCSTLVDRIVSGHPKDIQTENHLNDLIGENDPLCSIGEPFGLWVVEDKGNVSELIPSGEHDINVVISKDVPVYKKRKVRILNGSHTNLVPIALLMGKITVYDCMQDERLSKFVDDTIKNEILPFISSSYKDNLLFAEEVKNRFSNPYLNHQLTSIALNSFSKWKERDLPSFIDYFYHYRRIPTNLTKGFAALLALYSKITKIDGEYIVKLKERDIEIKDNVSILERFVSKEPFESIMSDESLWGLDLTTFKDFKINVIQYINELLDEKVII